MKNETAMAISLFLASSIGFLLIPLIVLLIR
jgi:hypothetical protein